MINTKTEQIEELRAYPAPEAAKILCGIEPATAYDLLASLNPAFAQDILTALPAAHHHAIVAVVPPEIVQQWACNQTFEHGEVGRLMEHAYGVFAFATTVGEAIEVLRALIKSALITYCYVVDPRGKLLGIVTMRDLLFTDNNKTFGDIMQRDVFSLRPTNKISDAMRLTLNRHYPVYPVCDEHGTLLGLVRGQNIFESEAFEITAQVGSMVGVDKEERLST
ncbi:MAG: CBS domain-containing protein, partial [Pseudomonadota bacterium]